MITFPMRKPAAAIAAVLALTAPTIFDLSSARAAADGNAGIAPHRAVYNLSMGHAKGMAQFVGADGIVTRSVERTCDGWITAEHLVMGIRTRVGGIIDREVRFTSWESLDGTSYRFASRTKSKAGDEDKRHKGTLKVDRDGGAGTATYTVPEGRTVTLPEGTYLPVGHVRKLLQQVRAGEKQTQFHIFDGTEEKGPDLMSSFVVGPLPKGGRKTKDGKPADLGPLAEGEGWRINAAFYEFGSDKSTPSFQIDMELMDNGLARYLNLDLGGFTIIQKLTKVEPLPAPEC